ncbi:fibroblast growth factor receptor 4 isoform X2 [Aplysia californica]|uniref:Fibroblast growth factor receptor 4 isoform X2 n=1 Tax=Aplysia californica TaxID=6500 RepID=A0ABM1VPI4_APLCA|nr:fibroblast growth factor receptor 4 isoform X2 [Aplysia californica]
MRTYPCIAAFSFVVLLLIQDVIASRRREAWESTEQDSTPGVLPSFKEKPTHVTYQQGEEAKLECSVNNLGTKKVIWRRKSDPNPLTISRRTFVDDERISLQHVPLTPHWHLVIKNVRLDDAGQYECQISSKDRDLRRYVQLSVKPGKINHEAQAEINITGKTYVEKDHVIRLVCNATGHKQSPDDLDWFLNGQKLTTDMDKKVTIQKSVSLMEKTIYSVLEVAEANMKDAGIYVCRTSDLQIASARVDVLNANTKNAKRGTEKDSSKDNALNGHKDQLTGSGTGGGAALHQQCTFLHLPVTLTLCVALWTLRHIDLLVYPT